MNDIKLIGLITRCKDEFFIKEFCDYYLSQGIDHIYIIDDDSNDKLIYENINDAKITLIYEKNIISNNYANKLYSSIKTKFKWMIYVDVDEFITTKKNFTKTIRDELETTFYNADCIKIPWVMMTCNNKEKNPKSILLENTYRWNHDLKHPNNIYKFRCRYNEIEVKCIFKTNKFNKITDHYPQGYKKNISVVDSIGNINSPLSHSYKNLRESNIQCGILLCYHYRIISVENSINKLKNNIWYFQNKYTIGDLMKTDYSEIYDSTLKDKMEKVYLQTEKKILNQKITLEYQLNKKELKFIHITKCAGTFIENIGKKNNIEWGRFHKEYGGWHDWFTLKNINLKNKYDWFTIVRNPYERILSEYYCEWGGIGRKNVNHDKKQFNEYLINKINNRKYTDGHYFEQYMYIDNKVKIHIIKFENLIPELKKLFFDYNIDIELEEEKINSKNHKNKIIKFSVKDFDKNLINLINNVYEKDFIMFNYKFIHLEV